jgi:hypothetical protein
LRCCSTPPLQLLVAITGVMVSLSSSGLLLIVSLSLLLTLSSAQSLSIEYELFGDSACNDSIISYGSSSLNAVPILQQVGDPPVYISSTACVSQFYGLPAAVLTCISSGGETSWQLQSFSNSACSVYTGMTAAASSGGCAAFDGTSSFLATCSAVAKSSADLKFAISLSMILALATVLMALSL